MNNNYIHYAIKKVCTNACQMGTADSWKLKLKLDIFRFDISMPDSLSTVRSGILENYN
jgi:NAD(P)H-nitrite reductase large subunit